MTKLCFIVEGEAAQNLYYTRMGVAALSGKTTIFQGKIYTVSTEESDGKMCAFIDVPEEESGISLQGKAEK